MQLRVVSPGCLHKAGGFLGELAGLKRGNDELTEVVLGEAMGRWGSGDL